MTQTQPSTLEEEDVLLRGGGSEDLRGWGGGVLGKQGVVAEGWVGVAEGEVGDAGVKGTRQNG